MKIKVDTRGLGKLAGTLRFSDLEKLPRVSNTYLLQCGAANPRGIVKWTGVRFSDFAGMLGLVPGVHYCALSRRTALMRMNRWIRCGDHRSCLRG